MIPIGEKSAYPLRHTERYGLTAIAFHWIAVVLIIGVGTLGLLHDSWPKRTQTFWINSHALLGLLVWVLVMIRFWWRRRHARPPCRRTSANSRAAFPVPFTACSTF